MTDRQKYFEEYRKRPEVKDRQKKYKQEHKERIKDHIKPCVSFDLTREEEQKKCFHYLNLQPLWAKENLSKGGK